jgi:hypothetical protein
LGIVRPSISREHARIPTRISYERGKLVATYYRLFSRTCIVLAASCLAASGADKSVEKLQSELNNVGYSLVDPARSDVVAGGFVVADKNRKHASYNDISSGTTFATTPFSASIYSATSSGSFSLAALVSSIAKSVSGGASVAHNSQLTLKQIDASGQKVDATAVVANPAVQSQVKKWLSDKAHYNVYIVEVALGTTSISITSNSSTDIAAAFGTNLPTCPAPSGTTPAAGTTPATATTPAAGATPAAGTKKKAGTPAAASPSPAGAATPNATLQACMTSSSVVGLSTTTPLIFATSLRPVTLAADGTISVSPLAQVAKAGEPANKGVSSTLPSNIDWDRTHAKLTP